ncbi:hypothetical protein EDB84DRAFT_1447108 [Lactarius hengduanensis]|nr:hypothetical protein EDB84DRAFT_1447108 [Lactarius hengduanensis]
MDEKVGLGTELLNVERLGCYFLLHTAPKLKKPNFSYLGMESDSRSATDVDDQAQFKVIHLKGIFIDFVKTPSYCIRTRDNAGVTQLCQESDSGLTPATLTIQRALSKYGLLRFSVKTKPDESGEDKVMHLEGWQRMSWSKVGQIVSSASKGCSIVKPSGKSLDYVDKFLDKFGL